MLTDYHVHLRPDDPDTPAQRFFTAENAARYREAAAEAGVSELGISEHVHRFRQALDVWRHPYWIQQAVDDLDAYCEFVAAAGFRVGVEMDYVPGTEERTRELLSARPFDYVIGSVHFIGEGAVDHPGYDAWEVEGGDPERVWGLYFQTLAAARRRADAAAPAGGGVGGRARRPDEGTRGDRGPGRRAPRPGRARTRGVRAGALPGVRRSEVGVAGVRPRHGEERGHGGVGEDGLVA